MNASRQFCPNLECKARGQLGQGNIVSHGQKRPRYRCKVCGKTFSAQTGTMFAGLRKPTELIVVVITLLAYGCPVQAIVHAFGLDERTVASWRERAGKHCEQVHHALVEQGKLDLVHVQADAHPGERTQADCLDGFSDDGFDTLVVRRSGQPDARSEFSGSFVGTRARLLPVRVCPLSLYGWLERLSRQYPTGVSRESQRNSRTRAGLSAGVATALYRHGHQTNAKETGGRSDAEDGSGNAQASPGVACCFPRRNGAQYSLY